MLTTTKAIILSEFEVLAREQYAGDVPADVLKLLARCVFAGLSDMDVGSKGPIDNGMVYLIGEITDESVHEEDGCIIDLMLEAHYNLPKDHPLTIIISSGGGSVQAGLAVIGVINQIRREGRKVNAHVAGWAMSMAFDILQCCDRRTMEPTGFLMVHEEQYGLEGSTSKHKAEAKFSEEQERALLQVLSSRTGKPVKFYQDKTKNSDWYVGAIEALAEGLIDEVIPIPALPLANVAPAPTRTPRPRKPKSTSAPEVA